MVSATLRYVFTGGVGLYLLYFYTDVVGISPSLAGLIYGIGMFWDAITDPFMGYVAERTRTKWGVYRPPIWKHSLSIIFCVVVLGTSIRRNNAISIFIVRKFITSNLLYFGKCSFLLANSKDYI